MHRNWGGVKLLLFPDNITMFVENPKETIKNVWEIISKLTKAADIRSI